MTITAANQIIKSQGAGARQRVPCAAEHIYGGTLGYLNSSGYLTGTSGTNKFAGVVVAEVDNSGGNAGDLSAEVFQEGVFELPLGSAVQADVGVKVYGQDNYAMTRTASTNPPLGVIVELVSTTKVMVKIDRQQM